MSLDLFTEAAKRAQQAADAGIALAMANNDDWAALATLELENIWRSRRHEQNEFLFEFLKFPIMRTCGKPSSPAAWGGLARIARKRGWIIECGTAQGQSEKSHASLRRTYKWA